MAKGAKPRGRGAAAGAAKRWGRRDGVGVRGLPNGNKKGNGGERPGKQHGEGGCKEQWVSRGTKVNFK